MRMARLAAVLLLGCVTAAVAMPSVMTPSGSTSPLPVDSGSFMLDTTPSGYDTVHGVTAAAAEYSVATSTGGTSLLFWRVPGATAMRGLRIGSTGVPLDSAGFTLGSLNWNRATTRRAVAARDTGWLVVWVQDYYAGIRACRVGAHGQRLDPAGITVLGYNATNPLGSVAASSSLFMVTTALPTSGRLDVYVRGVRPDGSLLTQQRITGKSSFAHPRLNPDIAGSRDGFLVVYAVVAAGDTDVCGTILDSVGVPLDTLPFTIAGEADCGGSPTVAFDGDNYLVAWRRGSNAEGDIVGRRVSLTGEILDPEPVIICRAPSLQTTPMASRCRDGTIVTWQDSRNGDPEIYAARVSPSGAVLDPGGVRLTDNPSIQQSPSASACDSSGITVWLDNRLRPDSFRMRFVPLAADASPAGPDTTLPWLRVIPRYAHQRTPSVAFNGDNYLTVWADGRRGTGKWDVYGIRVDSFGGVLDSGPIPLAVGSGVHWKPVVAACDSLFLVVWEDSGSSLRRRIRGARVDHAGGVLDPQGFTIAADWRYDRLSPLVASDGERWFVCWCPSEGATRGTLVSMDGVVADTNGTALAPRGAATGLAATDSCYLISWFSGSPYYAVQAVRVSREGIPIDTNPITVFDRDASVSTIASDGQTFIVCNDNGTTWMNAQLVSSSGALREGAGIYCPSYAARPNSVWSGINWLVFWRDGRVPHGGIYAARASSSLQPIDTFAFDVRPGHIHDGPVVARGHGQTVLVVSPCSTSSVNGHPTFVDRIYGQFLEDGPLVPRMLWPPEGWHFAQPPAWFLADTTLSVADSFAFEFRTNGAQLFWSSLSRTPCCTIPDTLLAHASYTWRYRAHYPGAGWSSFTTGRQFWIEYGTGVSGRDTLCDIPSLSVGTVCSRHAALTLEVAGVEHGGACMLELLDVLGRRVRRIGLTQSGPVSLDMRDATGRTIGPGIYYLRLLSSTRTVTRKLVLP
jgi:hypothetical protein